jgi:hypothetical protein
MGQGSSKDNSETINWNNIKTENISSAVPNFNGLSKDAKKLIASLNIPSITESETSEMNLNHILDKISNGLGSADQQKFNKLLEQVSATASDDLSNTSPFISSEMYEYLVNSKTSETEQAKQTGGSKKSKKVSKPVKSSKSKKSKGGALSDDSSDTSSTSSDSSLEDLIDSTEAEILDARDKKNKNKDKNKDKKHKKDDSDSELSGGELSYLSSSAHTEGAFSDSSNANMRAQSSSRASESIQSSSQTESSVTNENHGMLNTSVSVNTEDINMVSDY